MVLIVLGYTLSILCYVYTLLLLARMAFDWARFFAGQWRPKGPLLVLANLIYGLTDPPLRWLRRFIPPLPLGNVSLDVGFIVLFAGVALLGRMGYYLVIFGMR